MFTPTIACRSRPVQLSEGKKRVGEIRKHRLAVKAFEGIGAWATVDLQNM